MTFCQNCFRTLNKKEKCAYCGYSNECKPLIFLSDETVLKNRYKIGKVLGKGGFGITYLGFDIKRNRYCAVKEYYPESIVARNSKDSNSLVINKRYYSRYEKLLNGYYKEAEILNSIEKDNVIVELYDYFYENNTAYIVMEYVEGKTVDDVLRDNMVTYRMIREIMENISKALIEVHKYGIIHRDIGLSNILVSNTGQIKLIDFGAARYFSQSETKELSVIFNPSFAPPEQYSRKGKQGPWTDVYALCACAYRMITKESPPDAPARVAKTPLLDLYEYTDIVPTSLIKIIYKGLELEHAKRYQSMKELLEAINHQTKTLTKPKNEFYNLYLTHNGTQKRYRVPIDVAISVGRVNCSINIDSAYVSKLHCYIAYNKDKNEFVVINKSINGVRDRNNELKETLILPNKDIFYVVDQRIEIFLEYEPENG